MSYRSPSKFHKITRFKTNTGENFSITLTSITAKQFDGYILQEIVLENAILLVKSGCDINEEKIALALR